MKWRLWLFWGDFLFLIFLPPPPAPLLFSRVKWCSGGEVAVGRVLFDLIFHGISAFLHVHLHLHVPRCMGPIFLAKLMNYCLRDIY